MDQGSYPTMAITPVNKLFILEDNTSKERTLFLVNCESLQILHEMPQRCAQGARIHPGSDAVPSCHHARTQSQL